MVAYSFKRRFVDPIRVGLSSVSLSFDCQPKRQTIRALGKRRHARRGEVLQLYTAMRTKQCCKIGDARCVSFEGVLLKWSEWPAFMTFMPVGKERMMTQMERSCISALAWADSNFEGFKALAAVIAAFERGESGGRMQ